MYSLILLGLVALVSANVYQNTQSANVFYNPLSANLFYSARSANAYQNAQCPAVKPVEYLDLEAFGNGVWYEIARYPNRLENGAQCGSTVYNLHGDTILTKSYHVANGRLASVEGSARLAHPCTSQGKMIFTLPYGAGGANVEFTGYILDTDYENYAIVYQCQRNAETNTPRELSWIFSRTKTLDAITKAKIDKFIGESRFLDSSRYIYNDFSEASCRYNYL